MPLTKSKRRIREHKPNGKLTLTFPKRMHKRWNIYKGKEYRFYYNYLDDSITITPTNQETRYAFKLKRHINAEERRRSRREAWEAGNGSEERMTLMETDGERDRPNYKEMQRRIRFPLAVIHNMPLYVWLDCLELIHTHIYHNPHPKKCIVLW